MEEYTDRDVRLVVDMLEVEREINKKARELFNGTSIETQVDQCLRMNLGGDGLVILIQIYQLIALFSDPELKAKAEEAIEVYRGSSE